MAAPRGRGFSTGKALSILFRMIADGSQARAEVHKTAQEAAKEIRSVETLGQRLLTILSRPVRARLGLGGALGISALRENLRGLADKEIEKTKEKFAEVGAASTVAGAKAVTAFTAAGAAVKGVKAAEHAADMKKVAKAYSDTTLVVTLFEKVLARSKGAAGKTEFGTVAASGAELRNILNQLKVASSRGVGGGGTFTTVNAAAAAAQFTAGLNQIENAEERAALAARVFGADVAKVLPILEAHGAQAAAAAAQVGGLATSSTQAATATAATGVSAAGAAGPIGALAVVFAAAAAAGAIFYGVLFLIAKRTAEADAVIGRLAERTGIMAENLSVLDLAAKKADLEGIKSIQERIGSFDRILGQAADGNLPQASDLLKQLGIDAKTAGDDTNAAFVKIVNAYNSTQDPTRRALIAQRLFADRTGKLGQTLQEIGPDFEAFKKQLRDSGKLLSNEGAAAALEFQRNLNDLGQAAAAVGQRFGRALVAPISQGLKLINRDIEGVGSTVDLVAGIIGAKIQEQVNQMKLLFAFLKTLQQGVSPTSFAFSTVFKSNLADIEQSLLKTDKTIKDQEDEREETRREQELAARARVDALKAGGEEQERIEKEITQNLQRQLALRKVSTSTALEAEIEAKRNTAATALTIARQETLEEERRQLKRDETEANREANLAKLREKEKKIVSDFQSEEADLRTKFLEQQREDEQQARTDAIEATKIEAQTKIDALRAAADKDHSLRESSARAIAVIENKITSIELAELKIRIDEAGKDVALRQRLEAQRTQLQLKATQDRARQTREIEDSAFESQLQRLKVRQAKEAAAQAGDQGVITRLRDQARQRTLTFEQAERTILGILLAGFDRRIALLNDEIAARRAHGENVKELEAAVQAAEQERQNASEEGDRNVRDSRQDDLDDLRLWADRTQQILEDVTQTIIGLRIGRLRVIQESFAASLEQRRAALVEEIDLEHEAEATLHAGRLLDLQRRIQAVHDSKAHEADKNAAIKALHREEAAEAQRHADADVNIERDRLRRLKELQVQESGFAQGLETGQITDLLGLLKERLLETGSATLTWADATQVAFSAVGAAVNGLAQGVGQLVQQWVLMGTVGPNAMRKVVASVLAGVAAQAAVQAIMFTAYGIAALTPWGAAVFGPAPVWFKAAALMAAVAVIAGATGRAVAGNSFAQQSAGSTASGGNGPTGLNPIILGRNQPQVVRVIFEPKPQELRVSADPDRFSQAINWSIKENHRTFGELRELQQNDGG